MGAFKTGALAGFAIGYMKGAKAGRPRYDQINEKIKKMDLPTKIEPVKSQGRAALTSVMEKAGGIGQKVSIGSSKGPATNGTAYTPPGSSPEM